MTVSSTAQSERLFALARTLIPGGVNSPVRAFSAVGGTPRFIERASGARLWDVDGNAYLDYVMSWGPLINGHAYPPVVDALARAAERGTSFGAPSSLEVELAEVIVSALPAVEMVRFVNSGTEAAMSAIRLARAVTGRELIVKFAGNYHGHADMLRARAGSGSLTLGGPTSPGVPTGAAASTLVATYNDAPRLADLFAERGSEIAAVIVEPIAGNMGVVPPDPAFLSAIRELTRTNGALFIDDEVITGLRVGPHGAQGLLDMAPDITVLGKIIGGGLPVGAYGGRREVMERIAPSGPVYQAGTLSGNPLAMAAGLANVRPLRQPAFYDRLHDTTRALASGLMDAAGSAGVPVTVNWVTGMLTVFFTPGPVTSLAGSEAADAGRYGRFFHAMLERGIYLPPSQFEAWMLSSAHTAEIVDTTIAMARAAFEDVAD